VDFNGALQCGKESRSGARIVDGCSIILKNDTPTCPVWHCVVRRLRWRCQTRSLTWSESFFTVPENRRHYNGELLGKYRIYGCARSRPAAEICILFHQHKDFRMLALTVLREGEIVKEPSYPVENSSALNLSSLVENCRAAT